jgi:hypothetical protein
VTTESEQEARDAVLETMLEGNDSTIEYYSGPESHKWQADRERCQRENAEALDAYRDAVAARVRLEEPAVARCNRCERELSFDTTCYCWECEGKARAEGAGEAVAGSGEESLLRDIAAALNRHSVENESNTPDFILAEFVRASLDAYASAVRANNQWHAPATPPLAPEVTEAMVGAFAHAWDGQKRLEKNNHDRIRAALTAALAERGRA